MNFTAVASAFAQIVTMSIVLAVVIGVAVAVLLPRLDRGSGMDRVRAGAAAAG